jgi:hypothetical protein
MSADDFRNDFDDEFNFMDEEFGEEEPEPVRSSSSKLFLGMTATQRFVIAIMLLFMICILSSFCLLVTEKISLPLF